MRGRLGRWRGETGRGKGGTSVRPLAAAGEQVRGGRLRGAETEVGAGMCIGV